MLRRCTDEHVLTGALARRLTSEGVLTRTGTSRWDRSVVWSMLKNPGHAGRAGFSKTASTTGDR